MTVVSQEDEECYYEDPMHYVLKDGKCRQTYLHLVIELSHHRHLAPEAWLLFKPPITLTLFFFITIIMITLSILKRTNLHGLIIDSLVAEHRVYGCNCLYLH